MDVRINLKLNFPEELILNGKREQIVELVNGLANTRRMKRDLSKIADQDGLVLGKPWQEYGEDGEFYFNPDSQSFGQEKDESIVDKLFPPSNQPTTWLGLEIQYNEIFDTWRLECIEQGKVCSLKRWLEYLIEKIFKPNNIELTGIVYIIEFDEIELLIVKDYKITSIDVHEYLYNGIISHILKQGDN